MKNIRWVPSDRGILEEIISWIAVLLFCSGLCQAASAQTPPSATEPATVAAVPLNLDSDDVVKEMSKEQHRGDVKPEVFSSAQSAFELSILNSESRKKVSGVVEAGAGIGSMPQNLWHRAESFNCENAAAAINDQINQSTQVGLAAQVENCHVR